MIKYAALIIALLQGLNAFSSDNDTRSKTGLGFKGGLVMSTAGYPEEGSNQQSNRMKLGGFGGLSYEKKLGNVIALEAEALYANLGVKKKFTVLSNDVSMMNNFHTIQFPVNLKFYIGKNFNLYAGGYGQYMFSWKSRTVTTNSSGDVVKDDRSDNLLKDDVFNPSDGNGHHYMMPWDAGVQGGLEFISNMGLGVGARFQKGLIDITNDKFQGTVLIPNDGKWVTNTSLQIYLVGHF